MGIKSRALVFLSILRRWKKPTIVLLFIDVEN
jgi:hypothetical protein